MTWADPVWVTPEMIRAVEAAAGPWDGSVCADCGRGVRIGAHYVVDAMGSARRYCDPCARAREAAGLLFDGRPLDDILAGRTKRATV